MDCSPTPVQPRRPWAGIISGTGSLYVNNAAAILQLTGGSTYTGGTYIQSGVLQFNHAGGPLPASSVITFGGPGTVGMLDLDGRNQTVAGLVVAAGATASSQVISNSAAGTPTVTFNNASTPSTFNGRIIQGSGVGAINLVVSAGSLTLGGADTYAGGTTIGSGATLTIGGAGTLGSGATYAGAITDSGTFVYNSTSAQTLSGVISGAGALTQNGSGTLTLSGTKTYTGPTTISAGTLALGAGGSIGASLVTVSSGATLSNATTNTCAIGGATTLNPGALASFTAAGGASDVVGKISVTGNLTLNANSITVNVTGSALAAGSYRLMDCTGALTGSANTTPTITGTPLAGGYTATVASTTGSAGHVDLLVTNNCPAIPLTPASLPGGTVGGGYSQSLTSTGGTPPYSFAVTTGSLPAGLSLSGSGSLNGTPSAIGTNTFTVTATDTNGCTGSQAYTLVVGGPVSWTWNGSVSTDWFNPNNWTPVGVPGPNDTVNFASGTINLTAPVTFSGQFNWSGGTLSGNPLTITSNAMVDVSGSAFLSGTLNSTNATVGIIGTVASLTLTGGTILGGTVVATNGASLIVSSGTLDGVTFNGMLDVGNTYNGAVLTVTDGLVLDGTALVGNPTNTWTGQINFVGSQSLGGNGTIVFGNGWTYNYQGWNVVGLANGGTTLTIGPGITIRGQNGLVGAGNGWVGGPQNVGVINQGTISPDSGGTINIAAQPFTNQGVVQANSGGSLSISGLQNGVGAAVTLNGGGSLSLGGGWANAGTINATNVTVNLGGSFTLADLGTLNRSGGLVSVTGTLSNTNTVLVLDALGGSCVLTGGTILGGTVVATNGASLIVSSGTLDGVTFNGMLDVGNTYNGAVLTVTDGLVLDGTALVGNPTNTWTGQINFVGSQSLGGNGTIVFGNGWTYNYQGWNVVGLANGGTTLTIGPGITIRGQNGLVGAGNGWVGGPQNVGVINQGTISPDSGGTIIVGGQSVINQGTVSALQGAINFNNGLALNGGTLNFGISGPSSFGTMSVSGAANLGGGLSAVLLGGYVPAIGATFDVMTFASTNGAFTNYSGLNVGSGRVLVPLLSSTNLTLQAELPCPTITVGPPSLPSGTDGAGYSQSLTASGGAGPYSFTNSAGSLPAGLSLSGSGA